MAGPKEQTSQATEAFSTDEIRRLRRRLLAWYDRQKRDLPWRGSHDPYAIWVSEIMLQQTQVVTVIGYYRKFLAAFPTLWHLAEASEAQVLRQWEGLGYYRRARGLHRAAQRIVSQHGGQFPTDFDDVLALPGIGRYTAGAILSMAFNQRLPILEANTQRLYLRLLAIGADPSRRAVQDTLWDAARQWLPARRVGDFNQALMELGSLLCTPREPDCEACPLQGLCRSRILGLTSSIPLRARRPRIESVEETIVVVHRRGKLLLTQRDDSGRWAGMWDFVRVHPAESQSLQAAVSETAGMQVKLGRKLTVLRHGVTRFRITLTCYEASWVAGRLRGTSQRWVLPAEAEEYPLSVPARKIARFVTTLPEFAPKMGPSKAGTSR